MGTENQNGQDSAPKTDYINGVDGVNGRPVTKGETAYGDGYVEGQGKGTQYERERAAETNGLASGVVIGSVLAFAVGLGFAVWAYANRDLPSTEQSPSSINPVTVPASPAASIAPTAPAKQTTIIERTIEKPAPPPEVRVIEVPRAAPSPSSAPPSPAADRPSSERTTPIAPTNAAPTNQAPASPSASPDSSSDQMAPDSMTAPNGQGR
jgi:hypothetical protein